MAKLMYFAQLAETVGSTGEQLRLPPTVTTVKALVEWLGRREGDGWKALAGDKVTVMVNRQPATPETAIQADDEIAFILERLK